MNEHYDALETREPAIRERAAFAAIRAQLAHARKHAPALARMLAGVDADAIVDRATLARVPVTRKSALLEMQREDRPFGGFAAIGWGAARRVFASPGPIYEPEGRRPDYWRLARALFAAGFRPGDLIHNTFAYHFTPAGSMLETGAHALGCTVFPGGTGQTEQQVQAMADLEPAGYVGTPSFLRIILEKADDMGVRLPSLTKALVSGEAFLPAVRDALKARGIDAYQVYATGDLGSIAYESEAREGLIVDEGVLVEIVRPGTDDPVPEGEVGEVVVTSLVNADYPLVRFGTGDLSAVLPGTSPCGRTNLRIRGWMGRADQTTKVRAFSCIRGRSPTSCAAIRPSPGRASSSTIPRCRSHDPARRGRGGGEARPPRGDRLAAGGDQAARRGGGARSRRARQRRQGDRRPPQVLIRRRPARPSGHRPPMHRYFTSTYSSMPYFEPSRPSPDCLTPPKGATSVVMRPVLMPTMPYSRPSATLPDAPDVAAVEVRGEAVLGAVGELDHLVVGAKANERRDRAERLLAEDLHVRRDPGEDRRLVEGAAQGVALAARRDLRAVCGGVGDVVLHLVEGGGVDERTLRHAGLRAAARP